MVKFQSGLMVSNCLQRSLQNTYCWFETTLLLIDSCIWFLYICCDFNVRIDVEVPEMSTICTILWGLGSEVCKQFQTKLHISQESQIDWIFWSDWGQCWRSKLVWLLDCHILCFRVSMLPSISNCNEVCNIATSGFEPPCCGWIPASFLYAVIWLCTLGGMPTLYKTVFRKMASLVPHKFMKFKLDSPQAIWDEERESLAIST